MFTASLYVWYNIVKWVLFMWKKIFTVTVVLLIALFIFSKESISFDVVDDDGKPVTLTLRKRRFQKYYNEVILSDGENVNTHVFKDKYTLNIWKWKTGRVNDENNEDVVFGVYNIAPHHRIMTNRVFIYTVKDLELQPKFRASRLTYPISDFTLYDIDGDGYGEVVAIEKYKSESYISAYKEYDLKIERVYFGKFSFEISRFLEDGENLSVETEKGTFNVGLKNKEVYLK